MAAKPVEDVAEAKGQEDVEEKPLILMLQSTVDSVRAFDDGDEGFEAVFKRMDNFNFKHSKVSTLDELYEEIEKLSDGIIAHLIIMAHGNSDGMCFGTNLITDNIPDFAEKLKPKLRHCSSIFLHSCLVGKGKDSFAETLAKNLKGHIVFGATASIKRGDLDVTEIKQLDNCLDINYKIKEDESYEMKKFYTPLKCTNDDDPVSFDEINEIKPENIVHLTSGLCLDINSICGLLVTNGYENKIGHKDEQIWENETDLYKIINHPKINDECKTNLIEKYISITEMTEIEKKELVQQNIDFIILLRDCGFIFTADHSSKFDSGFIISQTILAKLIEKYYSLDMRFRNIINSTKVTHDNLEQNFMGQIGIIVRKEKYCVHGVGILFMKIFCKIIEKYNLSLDVLKLIFQETDVPGTYKGFHFLDYDQKKYIYI
jgi:hypothetical protein